MSAFQVGVELIGGFGWAEVLVVRRLVVGLVLVARFALVAQLVLVAMSALVAQLAYSPKLQCSGCH